MNKKKKKAKILKQVKAERRAKREAELALKPPKIHSTTHWTSKKDQAERKSNTIRDLS